MNIPATWFKRDFSSHRVTSKTNDEVPIPMKSLRTSSQRERQKETGRKGKYRGMRVKSGSKPQESISSCHGLPGNDVTCLLVDASNTTPRNNSPSASSPEGIQIAD